MNPFTAHEEHALRSYLSEINFREQEAMREEAGIPWPCDDCERRCTKACSYYGRRKPQEARR